MYYRIMVEELGDGEVSLELHASQSFHDFFISFTHLPEDSQQDPSSFIRECRRFQLAADDSNKVQPWIQSWT